MTGEGCCRKIVVISIKRRLQSKNRKHIDQKTIVVEMSEVFNYENRSNDDEVEKEVVKLGCSCKIVV